MPLGLDDDVVMTSILLELCWHGGPRPGSRELQWGDTIIPSGGFLDIPRTRTQDLHILKRNLLDLLGPSCRYEEKELTEGVGSTKIHIQICPFTSINTLI